MIVAASVAIVCVPALLAAVAVWLDRIERRHRAERWHAYFHGGGLVKALIRRWNGPRRLTYRPDETDT